MRKRWLIISVKGENRVRELCSKYTGLGYACSFSTPHDAYKKNPEEVIYKLGVYVGEKCPWFAK